MPFFSHHFLLDQKKKKFHLGYQQKDIMCSLNFVTCYERFWSIHVRSKRKKLRARKSGAEDERRHWHSFKAKRIHKLSA